MGMSWVAKKFFLHFSWKNGGIVDKNCYLCVFESWRKAGFNIKCYF